MLEVRIAAQRDAPARARTALDGLNGALAGLRQPVRLLVSELVTNAVQHAGGGPSQAVQVRLDCWDERVRVEVTDDGPGFDPGPRRRIDPVRDGFGLALVDQLTDRWGVEVETGACVWFEIDR
jgi:anti-sigma regulatory factor (Ser/Thr protein kinase)